MIKSLALVCLAAAPTLALAAPQQVSSVYDLYRDDLKIGDVHETYQQNGNQYRIVSKTAPTGIAALLIHQSFTATSSGRIEGDRLVPLHYEQRSTAGADKTITADFDWPRHLLSMHYNGKTETAALPDGAQDRLSLMYQMMLAPPAGRSIHVAMTTGKKLEAATFRDLSAQSIRTPAGPFRAEHLSRQHKPDEKGMEVWLATSRSYLPVRILMSDDHDGTRYEQRLARTQITD